MKMKKWIMLLLTFCMIAALSLSVSATELSTDAVSGDWTYSLSYGEATITGYSGSATSVTVPSSVGGYTVVGIGSSVFNDRYEIKTITLPSTLQTIGSYAFQNCRGLTEITLPKSLTTIGYRAFYNCYALQKITIHSSNLSSCDSYGTFSFAGKNSANGIEVIFSDSVSVIPAYIFTDSNGNTPHVTSVKIGKSVRSIGKSAFADCYKLKTVDIDRYMKLDTIGDYAFSNCSSITNMTIPSRVTNVGYRAFYNCTSMFRLDVVNPSCKIYNDKNTLGVPGKTVIYGYKGTTSETYANKYGYAFQAISIPFSDVKTTDFFLNPTMWAVENNITSGTSSTKFSPGNVCQRAQVVTFLWRAAGSPTPKSTYNPFVDVKSKDFFYTAVLWAVENGITSGADATHFNPTGVCNRAQVVTFLHKAMGSPKPTATVSPFADVQAGSWYEKAVLWAVENGITSGTSATTFSPGASCNRAQVVTFLYAAYN